MTRTYAVTGTSRGIGLELTRQLLQKENTVLALARNPSGSSALLQLKETYPKRLNLFSVDVTSDEQVFNLVKLIEKSGIKLIDVLINNAGTYGEDANLEKLSLEEVLKTFSTNAVAPMRMIRALLPFLRQSKEPKMISITSQMGSIADNDSGGFYGYRMSKAALNMFHKSLSLEYPQMTSFVINPGWVKTDMGGPDAPTSPEESVRGILSVIENAHIKDNGKFFDFEGGELPW